jgi:enoyl-CoA hydratase / 3-hydroxyacyl-CoA dehydrogenase
MADAAIMTVWFDNPPLNVIGSEIAQTLMHALDEIDDETRVVVLRGKGDRAFSAGADISGFKGSDPGARRIQELADRLEAAPVPVVAAIHGYCIGGGLELALGCDLRIARHDAQLGFPEVNLGLLPGGGGTQRAPRVIGRSRAAWLVMSGERIDAELAERWGLVDFVFDDLDAGIDQVAGTLAKQSPSALREIKQLLRATRDERDDDLELQAFARRLASEDGKEGVAAFLEKREPSWRAS